MKRFILLAGILLVSASLYAQDRVNRKVIQLGYRTGKTEFNPSYYHVPDSGIGISPQQSLKGSMPLGNIEFRLSRTREKTFYELNLDGLVYALGRMIMVAEDKIFTKKSWVNQEVDAPNLPLNSSGSSRKVYGVDQDILNLKFGWRIGKNFGIAPQFNMLHLYTGITPDSSATVNYTGFHDSKTEAMYSLGAGLMLRNETKHVLFQSYIIPEYIFGSNGFAIRAECNIFIGHRWGLYLTPFYKYVAIPATSQAEGALGSYTATSYGLKAGLYLTSKKPAE